MKTKIFLLAMTAFLGFSTVTFAQEGKWNREHPRRDEVNDRLKNQNKRIHEEVKEGDMTKEQAERLRNKDKQIRKEERRMAAKNGGHLTREQQERLNKRENNISRRIGK